MTALTTAYTDNTRVGPKGGRREGGMGWGWA